MPAKSRRFSSLPALCATVALLASAAGCTSEPTAEEVYAELEDGLAEQATIYHYGCDWQDRCDDGKRDCSAMTDGDIVQEATSKGLVVVEAEPSSSIIYPTYYWFVNADGSGSHFWLEATDVVGDDCGSYCGWHKADFEAGELHAEGDSVNFLGGDGAPLQISQWPSPDDEGCMRPNGL